MTIDKTQVARQFSRAAKHYDDFAIVQHEMANRVLSEIDDAAQGSLIDLGCGTGQALDQLQQRTNLNLTGVDIAPQMIKVARQRVPHANFFIADLEQAPFKRQTFDWVFSNAAIQWCDAQLALNEMKRLLRPNGKLLLASFVDGTLREWQAAWESIDSRQRHVHRFPQTVDIENCLVQAGFQSIDVHHQICSIPFKSVDQMIASVKRIGATYASPDRGNNRLTRRDYHRFREALAEKSSGNLQLSYHCVYVFAKAGTY